jgi:hypothetical protein
MSNDNIGGGPPQAPSSAETVSGEGSGHTPGPWFTDFTTEVCAVLDGGAVVVIADVNALAELTDEAAEANARLIAAAPAMHEALKRIERWFGEFPDTGRTWDDGAPMSYAACWGSNGERDFMRDIARSALQTAEPSATEARAEGHSQADAGRPTQPREERA